jgi:hypothetical protein
MMISRVQTAGSWIQTENSQMGLGRKSALCDPILTKRSKRRRVVLPSTIAPINPTSSGVDLKTQRVKDWRQTAIVA